MNAQQRMRCKILQERPMAAKKKCWTDNTEGEKVIELLADLIPCRSDARQMNYIRRTQNFIRRTHSKKNEEMYVKAGFEEKSGARGMQQRKPMRTSFPRI